MKKEIGWRFPKTNWGSENGKNDPGIETFRGNPYPALAREPIQNSLDAATSSKKPVRVEFSVFKLPKDKFPGRKEYIEVLKRCMADAKKGSDTEKEMEAALKAIEQDEIYFMKVSDFNTSGLSGSEELRGTDWHRLIKVVGDSDKEETSGGSFGIGKHAPFVCSDLKVVFYNTKDSSGKKAFQGVAKLITFMDKGEPHQATGFYGEVDKIQPIKGMSEVDDAFDRNEIGTDLFVAGFDYRETWIDEIIESTISSFFVAIHEGTLEVKVGDRLINQNTLPTFIEELKENGSKNKVINYYEVLTSESATFFERENFEGLGNVQLYIENKTTYNKKIAMVRKTGMVIRERQNYQIPNKYSGVLLIKGDAFNKELKRVENPTHTDWEFKRKKDVKVIKAALNKLYEWMNESIKSISLFEKTESFDVDELSQFLPDDNDENEFNDNSSDNEGESGRPLKPNLYKVKPKRKKGSPSNSDGKKKQKRRISNSGINKAKVEQYKLFCVDPEKGKYQINLAVKKSGLMTLSMQILGEESNVPAIISQAKIDVKSLPVDHDSIGPFSIHEGNNKIEFELEEKMRVALGVTINDK